MRILKSSLAFCLATMLLASAQAENWPAFRGPTGQGISTEKKLPLHWGADSNIVWKVEVPGDGWSSPVIWKDHVFVTTTTESGAQCHVIALDRKTGKTLWNTKVFEQVPRRKENKNSYATPTPVTNGKQVFAVFGDGSVAALDFKGKVLWTNREVEFYSRHGLGSSPLLYKDLLIMPYDGSNKIGVSGGQVTDVERLGWQIPWDKSFVVALNAKTGKREWLTKRGMSRISHVTPLVAKIDGKDQIVSGAGDRVQGFDPKTGELIWSLYAQGEGVTPSPVIADGMLYASSGFEKTTLRGVRLKDMKGDVTESHIAWEQRKGVPTQPSPVFVKPYLYTITDGGIVSCYQPASGEIVWQERVGGNHSASPVYADGRIYFLSETGESTVIAAGEKFAILAKNSIEGRCQASIAVSQGNLFIRTDKQLYCIGTKR